MKPSRRPLGLWLGLFAGAANVAYSLWLGYQHNLWAYEDYARPQSLFGLVVGGITALACGALLLRWKETPPAPSVEPVVLFDAAVPDDKI